jgi:hypothetical protein
LVPKEPLELKEQLDLPECKEQQELQVQQELEPLVRLVFRDRLVRLVFRDRLVRLELKVPPELKEPLEHKAIKELQVYKVQLA